MKKIEKSTIKRSRGLACSNLSTKFLFGKLVKSIQQERPFNLFAKFNHAFAFRAISCDIPVCAIKTFGCLLKRSFHNSHPLSIKVLGYLPIIYYLMSFILPMSTHNFRLFRFQKWSKKLVKSPFEELRLNIENVMPKIARQFVFLGGLT